MQKLGIIRRGHMGDILLIEPIIDALRDSYKSITIFTDYPHVADLLGIFDTVLPYDEHQRIQPWDFDRTLCLKYEIYPGVNHLDGYAIDAGVTLRHRVPVIRRGFSPVRQSPYGLIAPAVSTWIRPMREWSLRCFNELSNRLATLSGISIAMLDSATSFDEMLSLVEHCAFFVGNDSGPAILAQCFSRPTFVIFGATLPKLILLRDDAIGIWKDVGCNGCKHLARHTEIECASPLCLEKLTVNDVVDQMLSAGWLTGLHDQGGAKVQTVENAGEK